MKKGITIKNIDQKKLLSSQIALILKNLNCRKQAINFRSRRSWLKNRPLMVYAGAFGKVNDLSYIVELASKLIIQNPEIRILLIGDGIEKEELVQKAKKFKVYKKIYFLKSNSKK